MAHLSCPYLGGDVELTDERERHKLEQHPDLLPEHRQLLQDTLADPDEIRHSTKFRDGHLFSRWFENLRGGKHVVVVVVGEVGAPQHWIITAYIARRLAEGDTEWKRS